MNASNCGCNTTTQINTATATEPRETRSVHEIVREGYARVATAPAPDADSDAANCSCCGTCDLSPDDVAKAVGYDESDLAALPEGANMGLSCGNPTAIAALKSGETVLDLGSGGGFDCFLAGPRVGPTGGVIGVDMTPEMIARARKNLAAYRAQANLDNVEFRLGEIEHLPVPDNSVDVVISNCVINLSPDKPQVWREIARVLQPGGRVSVSDLMLLRPLPESIRKDIEALVGCIAGAITIDDTRRLAEAAGLKDIRIDRKPGYIESMSGMSDPLYQRIAANLPADLTLADYVTSAIVTAVK